MANLKTEESFWSGFYVHKHLLCTKVTLLLLLDFPIQESRESTLTLKYLKNLDVYAEASD